MPPLSLALGGEPMRTQDLGRTLSMGPALLLHLSLVLSVACGSDEASDPVTVVRSEDGATSLTIPEGALPEGVSPEDLAINTLPIDDDEAETTLVALELGQECSRVGG